jgi:outer membrane protein
MMLAVISAAAALATADTTARPISLEEAIALAQLNSPAMVQAVGDQRTAAAGVRSAYAAFIPSFSLTSGTTRQVPAQGARTVVENGQVVILPSQPWSTNIGMSANVTLFAGGKRIFDLKQAHAQSDAADAGLIEQTYTVRLNVQQQYFNALAAIESESAARAQLQQAQEQYKSALVRVHARTATRSDSLRAEIQIRNAQLALLQARSDLDLANASLTRMVATPYSVTAMPSDTLDRPGLALGDDQIRQLAGTGPAVKQAESAVSSARASRNSSWAAYLPTLNASYSRGGSGVSGDFAPWGGDLTYSGAVRLSASLPIFDQLQREEQVTRADVALDNAEAQLRDAQFGAQETAVQGLGVFHTAEERVAAQVLTVAAAEEDLRVQQQRYGVGESTLLDLLTSQAQLDQSRHDLIRARYDLRVARAQLEALLGRAL